MSSHETYLAKASAEYHEQLISQSVQSGSRTYLAEHAINDFAIAERYQIGYVGEPLSGDERYAGRLAIPYITPRGVVNIKFRKLGDMSGAKFLQPHGAKPRLYNVGAYFEADHTIALCEGEVDAIVATERLGIPTMGIPGSDAWSSAAPIWSPIFKDFRRVWIFADGDDAGERMATTVAESLGWRARIVSCPKGQDVSSMVAAGKAADLRELATEK